MQDFCRLRHRYFLSQNFIIVSLPICISIWMYLRGGYQRFSCTHPFFIQSFYLKKFGAICHKWILWRFNDRFASFLIIWYSLSQLLIWALRYSSTSVHLFHISKCETKDFIGQPDAASPGYWRNISSIDLRTRLLPSSDNHEHLFLLLLLLLLKQLFLFKILKRPIRDALRRSSLW